MNTPIVMMKMRRKMPPIMNINFMKRSQKSIASTSSLMVSSIEPGLVSRMPSTKFQGNPLACFSNSKRGVLSFTHPCLISQSFPPANALVLLSISTFPLSSQTSIVSRLLFDAVWQIQKIRMTQESISCVIEKKVQSLFVIVVEIVVPSFNSYACCVHPPTKPESQAQQLLLRQRELFGHTLLSFCLIDKGLTNGISKELVLQIWLID